MYLSFTGIDGTAIHFAQIRRPKGWGVNPERLHASRIALDGHAIHQTAGKDYSTAEVSVSTEDTAAVGDKIAALDMAVTTAFVSDGEHVYEAIFDAKVTDLEGRRKAITVSLSIVRKVI